VVLRVTLTPRKVSRWRFAQAIAQQLDEARRLQRSKPEVREK